VRITVTFTVSAQRQKYLRQALESWAHVRGVRKAHMQFSMEPDPTFPADEFIGWTAGAFGQVEVGTNAARLGPTGNTRMAMVRAFAGGADFAVCAEEDVVVASDILEYFTWAARSHAHDKDVLAVCAHVRASAETWTDAAVRLPWFNPLTWGTWRDRWQDFLEPGWGGVPGNEPGWDVNLRQRLTAAGKTCLFPVRSRSLHIGEVSTMFRPELSLHLFPATRSTCYEAQYAPQEYREIIATAGLDVAV
jgi:hypothetical protein